MTAQLLSTTTHVHTTTPVVALTFDDGPDPDITPQVLDILAEFQVRATFFMVGKSAATYPHLVTRVANAGHAIGNHSWDHTSFPTLSHWTRMKQIRATARILTPYESKVFRPPFGDQTGRSAIVGRLLGYRTVAWSGDAEDWRPRSAEEMVERLVKHTHAGAILLLHDGLVPLRGNEPTRTEMMIALRRFLERVRHDFQFITLPQLFSLGTAQQRPWYQVKQSGKGPNFFRTS